MALIEGLDDAVADEYERLRNELRVALGESGYTRTQVAALAGVGESTLRNILSGAHAVQIDTLFRIAFVLGARLELALPAGRNVAPPFQVVPLATGSRRSSRSFAAASQTAKGRRRAVANVAKTSGSRRRTAAKVQRSGRRKKPDSNG